VHIPTSHTIFQSQHPRSRRRSAAVELDVPIYIHPHIPPESVRQAYFSDLPPGAGRVLETAGWGWLDYLNEQAKIACDFAVADQSLSCILSFCAATVGRP